MKEVVILNSWTMEFLYNLNDTIFFFNSFINEFIYWISLTLRWELMIAFVYIYFEFFHKDQIIFGLVLIL